jgi:hypothetical protein
MQDTSGDTMRNLLFSTTPPRGFLNSLPQLAVAADRGQPGNHDDVLRMPAPRTLRLQTVSRFARVPQARSRVLEVDPAEGRGRA